MAPAAFEAVTTTFLAAIEAINPQSINTTPKGCVTHRSSAGACAF